MATSILSLAIYGLSLVNALPTSRQAESRQILGAGSSTMTPGDPSAAPTPCFAGAAEQSPCVVATPLTGGMNPPKEKREDIGIGRGSPISEKAKILRALRQQLIALENKPDKTEDDLAKIESLKMLIAYTEGMSAAPGANTTLKHDERKRFTLPPDYNGNRNQAIDALEKGLEQLQNKEPKDTEDYAEMEAMKEALNYLVNINTIIAPPGTSTTFHPGRAKRFTLPPDATTNIKKAIDELEKRLEKLQNQRDKSDADRAEIADIKAALQYLAGISSISAPDGSSTTFHPGKAKRFSLPPDAFKNVKKTIDELERQLEALQNKRDKTDEDRATIEDIKAALKFIAGISSISAPDGSSTTFHPGKRQAGGGPAVGQKACDLVESLALEQALDALYKTYGGPSRAPANVAEIEKGLIEALKQCAKFESGGGTGSITPDPYQPGGPMIPDPTTPGGPMVPDRPHSDSPVESSSR